MQSVVWLLDCCLSLHWTPQGLSQYQSPGVCPCCLLELAGSVLGKSSGCSRLLISSQFADPSLRWPGCLHMGRRLLRDGSGCICLVTQLPAVQDVGVRAPRFVRAWLHVTGPVQVECLQLLVRLPAAGRSYRVGLRPPVPPPAHRHTPGPTLALRGLLVGTYGLAVGRRGQQRLP